ncbi:sulfurtransferase TusA family protein [Geosporobacter ferrireducens]|uniref:sulfurtransferase TusA family protein n=1 Tax=Geosporobacter ferrireducens TaxID=1424294 RepID=UPI00139C4965|nr:sulfurtransferase TusA family protein [Geosporobacter ferrireducens]MTI56854.1 ferredoxin--nitrite reductase [Geosporobacter ferrireducens]
MIKIPQQVIEEEKNYRAKVEDLKKGLIEPERFKPYRVSMGIYEQRDNDTYMIRTRIPSGVIQLSQLKKISELAKAYSHGYIHFTTRQDIQFHKVTIEDTVEIMEALLEVGIVTKGTGGNTARNIACSPLSGVSKDDVFDVTSYALAATEYSLKDPTIFNLPRKYKIAFSSSPEDTGNATIADLGFIAKTLNGKKGFEVYGAGGLGGSPNVSIKLEDFIPISEVLYHVQAMKDLFEEEGDRTNKNKARIRYILQRLGEEGFKARYQEILQKVKLEKNIKVSIYEEIPSKSIGKQVNVLNPLVVEQKAEGFYSIYVHPQNGNLPVENLDKVIEFIDALEYEPSIRLSNTQGFFVRDLKGSDAEKLLDIILKFNTPFNIDNSIACAGAATCKLGLGLSQNLLTAIVKRFKDEEEDIKAQLPKVFISGCPNSCGQHQKGEIGLYGKAKRAVDGLVPMYGISFGGAVGVGKAVLGTEYGSIPAKKIPEFFYQLAYLKSKKRIINFTEFVGRNLEEVKELIQQFSTIESESENPDLYYDFGADEKFSLKGRGPGECSAGVLDVIKLDIANAQSHINDFIKTKKSAKLYEASVSAARALLILKGIDTAKERLIFKEFVQHFIDTGYVKEDVKVLIDHLLDYKLGDLNSVESHYEDVKYLIDRVSQMYESLNSKLEITLPKEKETLEIKEAAGNNKEKSLHVVDLKGIKCPMNFVKAKIEISKIQSKETIGFYLDDGHPIKNVPNSLEAEGHEIVEINENFERYNLLVVKKK